MERLDQTAEVVERRFAEGQLSEPHYHALREIIEAAEAGEWQTAEPMCYRFQKVQVR